MNLPTLIAKLPDGIQEQRPLIFEPRDKKKMSVVLLDFIEMRKQQLFADNRRMIIDII